MSWRRRVLAVVLLAPVIHVAAIWALPRAIVTAVVIGVSRRVGLNTPLRAPRATSAARTIVMPSPDLLYVICAYDVGDHAVRFSVTPPASYWSLSFFADDTDNYYVVNDRQVAGKSFSLVLMDESGSPPAAAVGVPVVRSPSRKGIALFRMLITSEADLPAIKAAQETASCGVI